MKEISCLKFEMEGITTDPSRKQESGKNYKISKISSSSDMILLTGKETILIWLSRQVTHDIRFIT